MNRIIIALVILASIGAGVYYYISKPMPVSVKDIDKITELQKNPLTVVYTNQGYTPKQITVKKGDTVKFVNLSDRKSWTASDEHPSHNIYPEFDQKAATGKESEYSFKFNKVGSWGYHNHSFSSHTGIIVVTE